MARTLNLETHALRRDEFVDAAQRLIQAKGYEQMSVHDVLAELHTSKGAFYHYFDSKSALLEAVIARMVDGATAAMAPMVADPSLSALQKLEGMFAGIARWKGERTELVLAVMEVWLADDNAIVRDKFRQGVVKRLTPLLAEVIEQGNAEGSFTAIDPRHVARVLVSLLLSANEAATELFYARRAGTISFEDVQRRLAAYGDSLERILGLPSGSFPVAGAATLRQWFD